MKFPKLMLLAIFALCWAVSCKKNYDTDGVSHGSLQDSLTGYCLPKNVHGIYKKDSTLGLDNYIDVHVVIDSLGSYVVKTDTVNGYSFYGKGTFGYRGDNLVRLYGKGKPILAGVNTFTVSYGSSSCQVDVKVIGPPTPPAVFTLDTLAGACNGAISNGTYTAFAPLTSSNTVSLKVNVVSGGTFSLSTPAINGMSFSANGIITGSGPLVIPLQGSGIPLAAGSFNFPVTNGTTCQFSITVGAPSGGTPAVFTLGGAPGGCTGATLGGSFKKGVSLTSANTVTLNVNVTTAGTFAITTNTVNGMIFGTTGTFATTGAQTVVLTGSGTPTAAGAFNFNASAASGTCVFSVPVQASTAVASFTMGGAPGSCSGATTGGTFTAGTALNNSNTATMQVNVTSVGSYTINTSSANGVSFSGSGVFTSTGTQTVVLTGTGTPTAAGTNTYTVSSAGTTCTFAVITNTGSGPTPTGDYFPLKQGNWWSYDDIFSGVTQPDSSKNMIQGTQTYNGNSYFNLVNYQNTTIQDTSYIRKSGNDYFVYGPSDLFSSFVTLDAPAMVDHNILKENAATNTTWSTPEYSGTQSGLPISIRYDYKIANANTSVVVNGKTYTNVIRVTCTVMVGIIPGGPLTTSEIIDTYYARGIGLVKAVNSLSDGTVNGEEQIRYYQLN